MRNSIFAAVPVVLLSTYLIMGVLILVATPKTRYYAAEWSPSNNEVFSNIPLSAAAYNLTLCPTCVAEQNTFGAASLDITIKLNDIARSSSSLRENKCIFKKINIKNDCNLTILVEPRMIESCSFNMTIVQI